MDWGGGQRGLALRIWRLVGLVCGGGGGGMWVKDKEETEPIKK